MALAMMRREMSSSANSHSLQSIIFFRVAPIAGLILLAIVGVSNYRVSQTLRREVQDRVDTSAEHAARQIETNLSATLSACRAVAANDLVVNGIVDIDHRNSTLVSYFKSLRLPGPESQHVTMNDYKGRVIVSSKKNAQGYESVAWYTDVMNGREYVGTDGTTLTIAVPVFYAKRAEAVIVSTFDLAELVSDQFSAMEKETIVFHCQETVLFSTSPSVVPASKKFQPPSDWLLGTAKLSSLPDHNVSYLESEQIALAPAREMYVSQLVQFLVLFLGLLAAIRMAARLSGQPLNEMLKQVGNIEKTGDLNLRVAENGPSEFQELAGGFNGMLGKLQQTTVSQEQFRDSEERLTFAIEGTNDGLWDWNMVTNEVWYSPRYKAMLGYDENEFPNLLSSFESNLHPDDKQSTWDAVERHSDNSMEYDVEHRLRMKSGEYLWVRARGAVSRDANGKAVRMSGSMQDVSERRRYQVELQNKKLELEEVLDALPIALVYASPDREIMRVNQAFTNIFGYSEQEAIGKSTSLVYAEPEQFHRQGKIRFNADAASNVTPYEVEYKREDGTRFIGESVGTAVFDAEGKPMGMLALITDVSERKAAQHNLRISQYAFENSSDAVFWILEDGSVSRVNQQAVNYLGYSNEELCQLKISEVNRDDSVEDWKHRWEEIKRQRVVKFDSVYRRKDGTTFDCIVTKHFLSFEGSEIVFATVRDISAEKEAEAALIKSKQLAEESERRFRALADSAAPLCWMTELDSSCSWVNKRWIEYSGRPLEEQTGTGWAQTVHPDDREAAKKTYLNCFEKQEPFIMTYRLRRHDGVDRWHTVNAAPRIDENGRFVGFVGMSFDIQDEKESRQALEASELALKDASESLQATLDLLGKSDGVWDWKVNSQETVYTQGFRKILGFEGDDYDGFPNKLESFNSRIHVDDSEGLWQEIERSFASHQPFVFEFRVRCKNEKYIWVRSRGSASYDGEGNPVHLVGSIYDISAQKDVELERDRFLATAAELYAAVDLDRMKWVQLSPAWSRVLGYDLEQILELPVPELHPEEEHEVIQKQVGRLLKGESIRGWVSPIRHQDGSLRYIEWNIDPPIPGEKIVYGAGRDVTKVREYLAQIEATSHELEELNEQYQRSNKDLAQFAYVASHDLQEPLRAVGGFLQLLQMKYSDQLDETASGYIDKSVSGAARMNDLINDLLYYSRVTSDNSDYASVELNHCVTLAIEKLAVVIESSEADIRVADLPVVSGIMPLLVQLLQNLIGNAIKYRGENAPVVDIWADETDSEVVLHVKDNGMGIAEEYRDQVFDLFKRLHHRSDFPGTGIGLAICQRVADRHNGSITVRSNDGPGSCFSVHLRRR
jgi:PAS domain S-box-containing protein